MNRDSFKALVLTQQDGKTQHQIQTLGVKDLPDGEVLVAVDYSSLNFKDAMAITGKGKIVRQFPMVPGVDFAGKVVESSSPEYQPGDNVVLTGWSVGERYWGGYAQLQRVKAKWLVPLVEGLDSKRAMAIGTAGLTAMLCVMTLEEAGISPDSGRILVTGAAGGVGCVAISILSKLGYKVTALTAPNQEHMVEYLSRLGAEAVISGAEWLEDPKPLEGQRWAGAIDVVGSKVLARVLSEIDYGGAVAACGLAGGVDLPTTVMPFILRGVRLLGVDSVMCPLQKRIHAWNRLAEDLPNSAFGEIVREISLTEIYQYAEEMMAGSSRGRVVVDLHRD